MEIDFLSKNWDTEHGFTSIFSINDSTLNNIGKEVCDVEGSGIDDCIDQCCQQSVCDHAYNPDGNPDKRCCTREERKHDPIPADCTLCTECCDDDERNQVPLPPYCSNCPRCTHPATGVTPVP